jgi:hypothetical protein
MKDGNSLPRYPEMSRICLRKVITRRKVSVLQDVDVLVVTSMAVCTGSYAEKIQLMLGFCTKKAKPHKKTQGNF